MADWSNFIVIDGQTYNIRVKTGIKRNADFLDKYAVRTEDGNLNRKLIGVYYNYSNIKFEKQTDANYDEYNRLYTKLTEASEFHTINIGGYQFTAYFNSISDEIYYYDTVQQKPYFAGLTVNFTSKNPALRG